MASEWTVETLKQYLDSRFDAVNEAVKTANAVSEQRATKIEVETKAKFENTNEWRSTVTDAQNRYLTRTEYTAAHKALEDKVASKNVQIFLSLGVGFVAVLAAVFNIAMSISLGGEDGRSASTARPCDIRRRRLLTRPDIFE